MPILDGASVSKSAKVHESSYVDSGAVIGENSQIWHFSHVLGGVTIGNNCVISQNVMIGPDVVVGNNCKIQNNVSLYKGVILEDGVFCGPSSVFTNVNTPRAEVNRKNLFLETRIGRGASIGANATIVCGNPIGAYAFIAAGSVVTKEVLPHALMMGNPARQKGWVSHAGEVLRQDMTCPMTGDKYAVENGNLVRV
jgi:UDP-2-acetamido-3-amino-2,3-dideoxy-glucuronate N-acetyltransferase